MDKHLNFGKMIMCFIRIKNSYGIKSFIIAALICGLSACGGGSSNGASVPGNDDNSDSNSSTPPPSSDDNGGSTGGGNTVKSVTLTWSPPTTRENGTVLPASEIDGYEIYYFMDGEDENDGTVVSIEGGSTTRTDLRLSTGTYHFAIAAVDIRGLVSENSDPVSIDIN